MLYVNPLANVTEARTGALAKESSREKLALQEYEHYFVFTLLQEMQKSVPKGTLFGNDPDSDYYREMLNDTLSGEIAKSGQFGIAKLMEQQLRAAESRGRAALAASEATAAPLIEVK
ncbi:MAG: rod-binding protein [Candidatus Hydrogenedentes bacterium]|nr:rod-binding protein [Candidatus Hydrogenedentota bacterium]